MNQQAKDNYRFFYGMQGLAYALVILTILLWFIISAKVILLPIVFAVLFAFMLKPLVASFQAIIKSEFLSIILSFLSVILPILAILFIFSIQVAEVFQGLPAIGDDLKRGVDTIMDWLYDKGRQTGLMDREQINENISELIDGAVGFIELTLSATPGILLNTLLTILYTYFFLYYRKGIKNFFVAQFNVKHQAEVNHTLSRIQAVTQKYLFGLVLVMLVMGTLNSLGLLLIGVERPVLWGFLAAILTVIPYIGTAIGGLLPFLYAAATSATAWQPFAVLIFYTIIQTVEGNLITPKVVGDSVSVNPMTAILSIIVGGYLWGVPGVVLALPLVAIVRIICSEIDWLKPIALLMSNKLHDREDRFTQKFNRDKFRIASIFRIPSRFSSKPKQK